jgi:L,D-transpeptidase YcbB
MRGPRYEYILASTALALILALPGASAQDVDQRATATAPQPAAGSPAATTSSEAPPAPAVMPERAATPDPLALLDPADRAVAEKVRDLLAAKGDKIFSSKKERAAVEAFYQNRNLAPLWLDKGVENARAKSAIARLKMADSDGLDPADYRTPSFGGSASPDALAEAELKLTETVLTYARHVHAGRFPYSRVSRNMELLQAPPDPADVLNKVAGAANAAKVLDEFSPPHVQYKRLKAMLAELRARPSAVSKPAAARNEAPLAADNRRGQRGEPASREPSVSREPGASHDRQIETIIANMERWRWYPRDLGKAHVEVNQPDFTLKVLHDGKEVWSTRIVIGKPSMPTPLLSETMKYITINPTWHVPPSIVHNEYLPALAQDPTVLARMGLHVHYGSGGVEITQPPGDGNALGRVRFNFPNRFLVYQHDTPDKYMFGHDVRAYSHGCMRVQDPAKYAEVLLNMAHPEEHWTAERVKHMFGSNEQDIQIQPFPIWVHLTYQTAFVDDAGKLQIRRDVYGLDSRLLAAIRSERGVVEPPGERKREPEVASLSPRRSAPAPRNNAPVFQSMFGGSSSSYGYAPGYGSSSARPRVIYR